MAARIFSWKIGLLFGLGIICALAFVALFLPAEPDTPTLSEELFLQEEAFRLNPSIEEDRIWQEKIVAAAQTANADSRLEQITADALKAGAFNAASAAANLVRSPQLRDNLLAEIVAHSLSNCATLPWGSVALRGMSAPPQQLGENLQKRALECKAQGKR